VVDRNALGECCNVRLRSGGNEGFERRGLAALVPVDETFLCLQKALFRSFDYFAPSLLPYLLRLLIWPSSHRFPNRCGNFETAASIWPSSHRFPILSRHPAYKGQICLNLVFTNGWWLISDQTVTNRRRLVTPAAECLFVCFMTKLSLLLYEIYAHVSSSQIERLLHVFSSLLSRSPVILVRDRFDQNILQKCG
jgi:hypothetical protein